MSISGCSTFLEGSKDSHLNLDSRAQQRVPYMLKVFYKTPLKSNESAAVVFQGSQGEILESFQRFHSIPSLTSSLLLPSVQPLWPLRRSPDMPGMPLCQGPGTFYSFSLKHSSSRPPHGSHPLQLLRGWGWGASLTTLFKSVIPSLYSPHSLSSLLLYFSSMSCIMSSDLLCLFICVLWLEWSTQGCGFFCLFYFIHCCTAGSGKMDTQ